MKRLFRGPEFRIGLLHHGGIYKLFNTGGSVSVLWVITPTKLEIVTSTLTSFSSHQSISVYNVEIFGHFHHMDWFYSVYVLFPT